MNCPKCKGRTKSYTDVDDGGTHVLCDKCERVWALV